MNLLDSRDHETNYSDDTRIAINITDYNTTVSTISFTVSEKSAPSTVQSLPQVTIILLCFYVIIFLVGMFGNTMVLWVVFKYKAMRTITNKYIACLSLSDILICLFAIPFTTINALSTSWMFGEAMCKIVPMVLGFCVFVSTLTSVVIAVDRYMVIVHPHYPRMTHLQHTVTIICIWTLSISSSIPIAVFTTQSYDKDGTISCREQWPSPMAGTVYSWFILSLQLIIPAVIIIFCYTAVSLQLYKRAEIRLGSRAEAKMKMDAKRNKRINKMLIAMVTIFICCWLPLDLFHFFSGSLPENYVLPVFLTTHVIAMSSVTYNPFLYGWMNENFNLHFRKIIPCLSRLSKRKKQQEESRMTCDTTVQQEHSLLSDSTKYIMIPQRSNTAGKMVVADELEPCLTSQDDHNSL